ncbi:MAG: RHS repeat-associated core domain-containing protein [Hyphomicrobiales bacterium]|nr:MAG: RHS repeat-associated core domain-containing protein [Hyphomicrobiales bacterium]
MLKRYIPGLGLDDVAVAYDGSGTSTRNWQLADERGSVIGLSGSTGAVSTINTYDEYGVPASGNVGRFQYTGQQWLPEASAYHYRARAYLPQVGRFLQTDPVGYSAGANLYQYVRSDPVNRIDRFGLQEMSPEGARCYVGGWCDRPVTKLREAVVLGPLTINFGSPYSPTGASDPLRYDTSAIDCYYCTPSSNQLSLMLAEPIRDNECSIRRGVIVAKGAAGAGAAYYGARTLTSPRGSSRQNRARSRMGAFASFGLGMMFMESAMDSDDIDGWTEDDSEDLGSDLVNEMVDSVAHLDAITFLFALGDAFALADAEDETWESGCP